MNEQRLAEIEARLVDPGCDCTRCRDAVELILEVRVARLMATPRLSELALRYDLKSALGPIRITETDDDVTIDRHVYAQRHVSDLPSS